MSTWLLYIIIIIHLSLCFTWSCRNPGIIQHYSLDLNRKHEIGWQMNNLFMHPPYTTAFSQQVRLCWKPGYPWTAHSPQTLWFPHPGSLFPPETEKSLYSSIHLTLRCEQAELWCRPTGHTITGERFKCLENWALQVTTDLVQLSTDGLR